ncbi:MAG: glycosyltransferase [Anaerolineae bacterium]
MRILMSSHGYPPTVSGVTRVVEKLAKAMVHRGHPVTVITASDHGKPYETDDEGVRLIRVQSVPNPFWEEGPLPYANRNRLEKIVAEVRPEIVHCHDPIPLAFPLLRLFDGTDVPLIATCHYVPRFAAGYLLQDEEIQNLIESVVWKIAIWLYNQFHHLVFASVAHRDLFLNHGLSVPTSIISNGVDINRYYPSLEGVADVEARYRLPPRPRILFVSRLAKDKKIDILIQAMAHVWAEQEAHLLLVGRGQERERLETLSRKLGVEHCVHFVGFVPEGDMPAIYRAANLFAIASTYEVQSLPALQAAATGLPIVAVEAVALPELVCEGVNGLLVPPDDPQAMARAIGTILQAPDLAARMGQAGLSIASSHVEENTFRAYEDLYRQLSGSGSC